MSSRRFSHWDFLDRQGVVAAGAVLAVIFCSMGCLSIGGKWVMQSDDSSAFEQSETVGLKGKLVDVYYPIPYTSPPHLAITNPHAPLPMARYEIVEQKADHFRLRLEDGAISLTWTARGVRMPTPHPAPPAAVSEPPADPPPAIVPTVAPASAPRQP